MNLNLPSVYIKLPVYIKQYLMNVYQRKDERGGAVHLPDTHPVARIIFKELVSNPDFVRLTPLCYNKVMFDAQPDAVPEEWRQEIPLDHNSFCPFLIPVPHYWQGKYIPQDESMQLRHDDAKEVRRILEEEFWEVMERVMAEDKILQLTKYPGHKPQDKRAMQAFCEAYGIAADPADAMERQWKRRRFKEKSEDKS